MNPEAGSKGFASVNQAPAVKRLQVLTVNTHKGFTAFNRRFILPELREAVRSTQADIVFLQEVLGSHDRHAARYPGWPQTSQYEFLADSMWSDFAYGRNAVEILASTTLRHFLQTVRDWPSSVSIAQAIKMSGSGILITVA